MIADPSITLEQLFFSVIGGISLASLLIWRFEKWTS